MSLKSNGWSFQNVRAMRMNNETQFIPTFELNIALHRKTIDDDRKDITIPQV